MQIRTEPTAALREAALHLSAGRVAQALAAYAALADRDPGSVPALAGVAASLHHMGRLEEAIAAWQRVIARAPTQVEAHFNIAIALLQSGRFDRGAAHLRLVTAQAPGLAAAWANLGFALRNLGNIDDAAAALEKAIALEPGNADAHNNLGLVRNDQQRYAEACEHYRRALAINPRMAITLVNLANAEQAQGRLGDAEARYREALALDSGIAIAHYNLAHLCHKSGRLEEAIAGYRAALAIDPAYRQANQNLGDAMLLLRRWREGWQGYAWRPPRLQHEEKLRALGRQYLLPGKDALGGRTLAIRGEQGLGDVLFFLRFAPALGALGAKLQFIGEARLLPLLERTGLFERLLDRDRAQAPADATEVLAGDLPLLLHADAAAPLPPPLRIPPLAAALESVRAVLAAFGPPPYIGIAWRAGEPRTGLLETLFKEVPTAALGAALRGLPATLVSLQRAPAAGECVAIEAACGRRVHDGSALNHDLEHALAAMHLLDEYAGVSSTNIHLRAAVGRTARVLVPFPPEWRWTASGASPWFDGFSVYRQDPGHAWDAALGRLAADLAGAFPHSPSTSKGPS
jgi:tetratricopeptide (TPR) repeat protein